MSTEQRRFTIASLITSFIGLAWGDGERGVVIFGIVVLVFLYPIYITFRAVADRWGITG